MHYLILFLFILALILFWQSGKQRREAGLPGGRVIYTDTGGWGAVERPLYYPPLKLTGKPDYLVRQGEILIPVEVKSGRTPEAPYDSHIFQLASYCLLVEKTYGKRPPYGIIHYSDRNFAVDYTPELEFALMDLLADMRRDEIKGDVDRSHEQAARCAHCGFRNLCDQSLV
ncbi:MAG: Dna2/Cas4 domain-containing protein [Anaerolineales bacterium]|nr:Dna2/Cas4 domain-containing protein [Anaerolineales bacterium]